MVFVSWCQLVKLGDTGLREDVRKAMKVVREMGVCVCVCVCVCVGCVCVDGVWVVLCSGW